MSKKDQTKLEPQIETNDETEVEIDFMELFYHLAENWKRILAVGLVGMLVFAFYSFVLATPKYESTCKIYVRSASDSAINLSDLQIGSYLTSDYTEVFDTWEVQEMVLQGLNLDYTYDELDDMLSIDNPSNTRILCITVTSDDAQEAADIANKYAEVASEYIADTMMTDKPTVLSEALASTKPVSPKKLRNTILGFILGALLMAVILTVRFLLDDKVKTSEDIRKYADMPTLAVVPTNGEFERVNRNKSGNDGRKQRRN